MTSAALISILIVDDEPPARRHIRALLEKHADAVVVGEARNGLEAVALIEELRPDVVFLDVQMPEADGFEVIRSVGAGRMPIVVFATAYDEYALRAFEVHALDYLLKPFDRARFDDTLERVREHVRRRKGADPDPRLIALVRELDERAGRLSRLTVRVGSKFRLIQIDDVDYFESEANYVRLHAGGKTYLVRGALSSLAEKLDPAVFLRVHRSLIVNVSRIMEVESMLAGEYLIALRDGTRLTSGRTYRAAIQEALQLRA